jgi:hypothetical protein
MVMDSLAAEPTFLPCFALTQINVDWWGGYVTATRLASHVPAKLYLEIIDLFCGHEFSFEEHLNHGPRSIFHCSNDSLSRY